MSKITLTRTNKSVSATYLPYAAYKSAIALATAHKGKIDKTAEGNFKATFNSVKTAEKFVSEWTAEYEANRKVEVAPAPKSTPKSAPAKKSSTSKPTATKGKTATVSPSPTEKLEKFTDAYNDFLLVAESLGLDDDRRVDRLEGLLTDLIADANAYENAQTSKKSKPTKASSTKKAKAPKSTKGEAFNFNAIKGKTNADKNKALHKELVKMGLKDSRTPEYMSIWNARPWAK
jgi:hypothetical protein